VHPSIFISVFNQLDAQNLFHNKFYFVPLHVSSTCAHQQEVKIALHSPWYHHTEASEWSKITKIQFYKYEQIVEKFMCEFFRCDYCVLLTINMLCHVEVMFIQLLNLLERYYVYLQGDRGSTMVRVLCYKSEGRWFDPSWFQWISH